MCEQGSLYKTELYIKRPVLTFVSTGLFILGGKLFDCWTAKIQVKVQKQLGGGA